MWTNKQRITETEIASKITADRQLVKQTSCTLLSLAAAASSWTALFLLPAALSAPVSRNWNGPSASPAQTVFSLWLLSAVMWNKCKFTNIVGNLEKSMWSQQ